MTQEAEKLSQRTDHFVRKLAGHQAVAFRKFGDALEQFGGGEIGASGVVKVAGDLYFRELARIASEVIGAVSEAWDWGLARAGAEEKTGASGAHEKSKTTRQTKSG